MLNITQSALSHQVKGLEDQAGVELFVRRSKPLKLSAAGYRLLKLAEKVLPEIEAFDLSHIFQAVKMAGDGRLKGPLYIQFVMGVKNAMPVDRETFDFIDPFNYLNVDNDVWRFSPPYWSNH